MTRILAPDGATIEPDVAGCVTAEEPRGSSATSEWTLCHGSRMRAVKAMIDQVAPTDATILVIGESGVGKEMVTRTLHQESPRCGRPFVKVNCAALPLDLLESELFGYERGAFTGANRQKPGKFELANTGTIFLDEIAEMPMALQAKLLQVLQDRQYSRLGSKHDIRVDVRVVASTNKSLLALVEQDHFRDDLYYRLNVVKIRVPPLRERREEIPALVEYFLDRYARQYGRCARKLSGETMRIFMEYEWPGNVRELENCIIRIVLLETEDWLANELRSEHPASEKRTAEPRARPAEAASRDRADLDAEDHGLKAVVRFAANEAERLALRTVLDRVHWHRIEAARRLKISYKTLLTKMKQHGLVVLLSLCAGFAMPF